MKLMEIDIINLNITNGDVVMIRTDISKADELKQLADRTKDYFSEHGLGDCLLLFVDKDIKRLDEKAMKDLGWVKYQ
jgi:hypothetical protein